MCTMWQIAYNLDVIIQGLTQEVGSEMGAVSIHEQHASLATSLLFCLGNVVLDQPLQHKFTICPPIL